MHVSAEQEVQTELHQAHPLISRNSSQPRHCTEGSRQVEEWGLKTHQENCMFGLNFQSTPALPAGDLCKAQL